jgi:TatD DNase family protein
LKSAGAAPAEPVLVDTHCHLDFNTISTDVDAVIDRAKAAGVTRIIIPALDLDSVRAIMALVDQYEPLFAAVGVHPNSARDWQDAWIDDLREFTRMNKVVAIGEIGLDYYWNKTPSEVQHHAFAKQLELAAQCELPVIVHNREASSDIVAALEASSLARSERPGVLHSFSADWSTARAVLDLGFYVGFTGPLTYRKADELREIASRAPLDRILVETDSPFQTPHPHRGSRNEPAYVRLVAEKLAEIRDLPYAEVARITTENAERLFDLDADRR